MNVDVAELEDGQQPDNLKVHQVLHTFLKQEQTDYVQIHEFKQLQEDKIFHRCKNIKIKLQIQNPCLNNEIILFVIFSCFFQESLLELGA